MSSLKAQLLSVEEEFFRALVQGEDAVVAFNSRWDQLVAEIDQLVDSSTIDSATLSLVYSIASRIATVADTSIALFTSYEAVNAQLMDQLDTLMSELSLSPAATTSSLSSSRSSQLSTISDRDDCESSTTCRKRRRSSEDAEPRSKRRRSIQAHTCLTPDSYHLSFDRVPPLPSRLLPDTHALPRSQSEHPTPTPEPSTRKRRASESDTSGVPPQSKRRLVGPRLHAVSDSFILRSPSAEHRSTSTGRREPADSTPIPSSEIGNFWSSCNEDIMDTPASRSIHSVTSTMSQREHDLFGHLFSSLPAGEDAAWYTDALSLNGEAQSLPTFPRATSPSSDTSSTPSSPPSCPVTPQLGMLGAFDLDPLLALRGLDASCPLYDNGTSSLTSIFGQHISECAATHAAAVQVTSPTFPQTEVNPDWFASSVEPLINMAVPSPVCCTSTPGSSSTDFSIDSPFEITSPFADFGLEDCTVALLPEMGSPLAVNI